MKNSCIYYKDFFLPKVCFPPLPDRSFLVESVASLKVNLEQDRKTNSRIASSVHFLGQGLKLPYQSCSQVNQANIIGFLQSYLSPGHLNTLDTILLELSLLLPSFDL